MTEPTWRSWGFFAYDDGPPFCGGGTGFFCWYDSKEEMLETLHKHPFLFHSDRESSEEDEAEINLANSVRSVLEKMGKGSISDSDALEQLNKLLARIDQIEWWGSFEDLVTGDSEYAKHVRDSFGKLPKSVDTSVPVAESKELNEFISVLQEWGH